MAKTADNITNTRHMCNKLDKHAHCATSEGERATFSNVFSCWFLVLFSSGCTCKPLTKQEI